MSPTPEGVQNSPIPPHPEAGSSQKAFLADGAALGASAIVTALIGLVGWLLAARILEPAEVGRASAFVNGFIFVAGVAELGVGQACLKWLPAAGSQTRVILVRVYTGVLASAAVVGVMWALVMRNEITDQVGSGTLVAVLLFMVAAITWTLFHVQNIVLTALGAARWVPVEMIPFGLVRVVLLVVLARSYGALGIILSWVLPTLAAVLVVALTLLWRRHRRDGEAGTVPDRRSAVRMAGSIYVSTVGVTLVVSLVPVLVTGRYGPAVGAVFFIVWNGVAAVELAAIGFGSALVIRLSGESMTLLKQSLRQVLPLFAIPLAIAALLAEPLLSLFGGHYADEGTALLRWVCAGLLLRLVGVMVVSIHLSQERTVRLVLVNAAPAVALIVAITLLPVRPDLGALGLTYLIVQVVVTTISVLDLYVDSVRRPQPVGA